MIECREGIKWAACGTQLGWHWVEIEDGDFSYSCLFPPMRFRCRCVLGADQRILSDFSSIPYSLLLGDDSMD